MTRKIIYVTSSSFGTFATHDLGYPHNFERTPHEMRVNEIICNKENLYTVGPETVRMLYLIPANTVTNNFLTIMESVINEARSTGETVTEVKKTLFPGYINSLVKVLPQPFRKTRLADYLESNDKATFNEIDDLISKVNRYLAETSPRWSKVDLVPQLMGRSSIRINPGILKFPNNEFIYTIPLFGPQLRRLLGLHDFDSNEFNKSVLNFIQKKEPNIENGLVSQDHFIDHFFTVRCNLVQNKLNDGMKDYGILFAWRKDPERQTDVVHIKNKSKCWIPCEKISSFRELRLIIGTSTDRFASFLDDYTLVVIELRPRKWKEQST